MTESIFTHDAVFTEQPLNNPRHYLKSILEDLNSAENGEKIALSFFDSPLNELIKNKTKETGKTKSWLALCIKIINTLNTCGFNERPDYDTLTVLVFCYKLGDYSLSAYGANVYANSSRVLTIFFRDPAQNNLFSLYTDDLEKPLVLGSWSVDIKPMVKTINTTGLELILSEDSGKKSSSTSRQSPSILNTYYRGNTISVPDLINYINKIKQTYGTNKNDGSSIRQG